MANQNLTDKIAIIIEKPQISEDSDIEESNAKDSSIENSDG
jgi:hypothetical protein